MPLPTKSNLLATIKTEGRQDIYHLSKHSYDMLATMDAKTTKRVVDGTLTRVALAPKGPRNKALTSEPREGQNHHPAILARDLVDEHGQPLDQEHAAFLLDAMEEYANTDEDHES